MWRGLQQNSGMNLDFHPFELAQGQFRYALNAIFSRDTGAVSNEGGTSQVTTLKTGYTTLGEIFISEKDKVVFLYNGTSSIIGRIQNSIYSDLVNDNDLAFSYDAFISGTFKTNESGEIEIYWVDGINEPRRLNIDNVPSYTDISELRLTTYVGTVPSITLSSVNNSGGVLQAGAYFVYFSLVDADDFETPIIDGTRQIHIEDENLNDDPYLNLDGAPSDTVTTKSITLSLNGLDTNFKFIKPYVVKVLDGVASVNTLANIPITGQTRTFTFTGNETQFNSSLDELNRTIESYAKAKSLDQLDNALYMANLEKRERPDIQAIANNIVITRTETELDRYGTTFHWKHPQAVHDYGHFMNDEVYAFYFSLVYDDGTESEAYHIPGRAPELITATEALVSSVSSLSEDDDLADLKTADGYSSADQQADIDRFLTLYPNAKIFHYFGFEGTNALSYWENTNETYPNDSATWGALAGQPVRHHRFPAASQVNFFPANDEFRVNGINVSNVIIPSEVQEKIIGWKIYSAKRTNENKRILDQSLMTPSVISDHSVGGTQSSAWCSPELLATSGYSMTNMMATMPWHMIKDDIQPESVAFLRTVAVLGADAEVQIDQDITNAPSSGYDRWTSREITMTTAAQYTFKNNYDKDLTLIVNEADSTYVTSFNGGVASGRGGDLDNDYTVWGYIYAATAALDETDLRRVVNLHSGILDCYNTFGTQPLVDSGFMGNPTQTSSGAIYFGDCTVGVHNTIGAGILEWDTGSNIFLLYQRHLYKYVIEQQYPYELREEGTDNGDAPNQLLYPKSTAAAVLEYNGNFTQTSVENELFGKPYINYNQSYTFQPEWRTTKAFDPNNDTYVRELPSRVVRSETHNQGNRTDKFRTFLPGNYLDLPLNKGEIEVIKRFQNNLIIHQQRTLWVTVGKEEFSVDNSTAYIGAGDIFARRPKELLTAEEGYAGNQNIEGSQVTKYGYFFMDRESNEIFNFNGEIRAISDNGLRQWLAENSSFLYERYATVQSIATNKSLFSIRVGYENDYHRVMITKRDLELSSKTKAGMALYLESPTQEGAIWLEGDGYFYENQKVFGVITPVKITYQIGPYFDESGWTLSYAPQLNAWLSFHSYIPEMYSISRNKLMAYKNGALHTLNNSSNPGQFFGTYYPFKFEFVSKFSDGIDAGERRSLRSIIINTTKTDQTNKVLFGETFTSLYAYTDYQTTGERDIIHKDSSRHVMNEWSFNRLRDMSTSNQIFNDKFRLELNEDNIDENKLWHKRSRLVDKYIGVRLSYTNDSNNNLLTLHTATAVPNQTAR